MQNPAQENAKMRDALVAAKLYYQQDLTMDAIGRELKVSRSSVSRLLDFAREAGIVDIRITSPQDEPRRIEEAIRDKYGVASYLVPVPQGTSHVDRLERVGLSAARMLGQFFSSNMIMGIAWGSTISAISRHLLKKSTSNTEVVQLNGAGNDQTSGVTYSSEILRRFGEAYSARVQHFPVPAFFDDPRTKELLWKERSTQRVLEIQKRMEIAMFGLGSTAAEVPSQVYTGGYLSDKEIESLRRDGVVGDVATVFYRADGSWRDVEVNQRSSGPSIDIIRAVPRRLCVISGVRKLEALKGALAAGLVSDLIIDEVTARALVEPSSVSFDSAETRV
jgi:DNA-binding transcriptional regulator LsrR (DeoR family)